MEQNVAEPLQQSDDNSNQKLTEPAVVATTENIDGVKPVETDELKVSNDTKIDLEEKLNRLPSAEKPVVTVEEKVQAPIVVEAEVEKKETLTKVEVVVSNVVEDKVETVVKEAPAVVPAVEEAKTEIPASNCILEETAIIVNNKAEDLASKTAELVSSKSETDCSIKESAVIEEAAA